MKKIKIIIGALVILFLVLAVVVYFYPQFFKKLSSIWGPGIPEGALPESLGNVTQEEKEKVWGKTYEEIIADFEQDKQACMSRYEKNTNPKTILKVDDIQALSLAACQAVKTGDKDVCRTVEGSESIFKQCQEMARTYLDLVFPFFQNKSCSAAALSAEEKNVCEGIIFDQPASCAQVANTSLKALCLAVAENKISNCDGLTGGDGISCRDFYLFSRAFKENNLSYLNEVESNVGGAIYKLYFNRELVCADLLTPANERYCQEVYSEDILNRRLGIWSELTNLANKK